MHGRLAALAGLLTLALAPAALAEPTTYFTVSTPRTCIAGACLVKVQYAPNENVRIAVDWDHVGSDPAQGFRPDRTRRCAPPGSADGIYVAPAVTDGPCTIESRGRDFPTAGTRNVALRITGDDGVDRFALRTVKIAAAKGSEGRQPSRGGGSSGGGHPLCAQSRPGAKCQPGGGRKVAGGGDKVSHKGWPAITGVFWQVITGSHAFVGGPDNDELLGHHGNDRIVGKGGKDVLWGDWDPANNTTRQKDVLDGGAGNDWIYTSHGRNTVRGGPGKDLVWAYYGRGTIDCGPGFDTLRIRLNYGGYRYKNCERIKNFCSFGSKPGNAGGCYKPGERPRK